MEDLLKRLLFVQRIEEGIRQSENGETLTEAEARDYLDRWTRPANPVLVS